MGALLVVSALCILMLLLGKSPFLLCSIQCMEWMLFSLENVWNYSKCQVIVHFFHGTLKGMKESTMVEILCNRSIFD